MRSNTSDLSFSSFYYTGTSSEITYTSSGTTDVSYTVLFFYPTILPFRCKCQICKNYINKDDLYITIYTSPTEAVHVCKKCLFKYSLKKLVQIASSYLYPINHGFIPYKCKICRREFKDTLSPFIGIFYLSKAFYICKKCIKRNSLKKLLTLILL